MRLIFHLDVDAFFASAEQSLNPFLRGKPVIVGGHADQRGVVHSASYEAREFGVRTGMPLRSAKHLCPQAVFLKGNFLHYKYISREILDILLSFSPLVEFTSLDDAYVDMSGTSRLYVDPHRTAEEIRDLIDNRLGVPVSIGIGSSRLISRIASGRHKPRGITVVPAGKEPEFLHPLPVSELLGVGRVTRMLLCEMGIHTVGQLARIPKTVMEQLLGMNGAKIWEFANCMDDRKVLRYRARKQISRETTFEEDVMDAKVVFATIQYLSERIASKLRSERMTGGAVCLRIRYSDLKSSMTSRSLPRQTQDSGLLSSFSHQLFLQIQRRRTRIRHVHVSISKLEPENWQPDLFSAKMKDQSLMECVDEIRNRYGFTSIMPAKTQVLATKYRMNRHGYILHTPSLSQ